MELRSRPNTLLVRDVVSIPALGQAVPGSAKAAGLRYWAFGPVDLSLNGFRRSGSPVGSSCRSPRRTRFAHHGRNRHVALIHLPKSSLGLSVRNLKRASAWRPFGNRKNVLTHVLDAHRLPAFIALLTLSVRFSGGDMNTINPTRIVVPFARRFAPRITLRIRMCCLEIGGGDL